MGEKGFSRNGAASTQTTLCRNAWVEVLPVVFLLVLPVFPQPTTEVSGKVYAYSNSLDGV